MGLQHTLPQQENRWLQIRFEANAESSERPATRTDVRPPCQGRPFRVTVLPLDRESLIHVHRGRHFRVTGLPSAPRRQRGSAPPPRQAHSRHLDPPPPFAILVLPPTLNHAVSAAALPKTTNSTDNCSQTATIQDLKVANSTYRLPGPALPQSARARLDSWLRRVGILPSGPPARAAEARKRADSEQRRNLTLRNGNMKRFVRTPSTGWLGGSKNRDARSLACSKNVCSLFFSGVGLLEDGTAGSVTAQRAPPRRDLSVGAERPARSGARKPGPREAPRRPPRRPCPYLRQRFPHRGRRGKGHLLSASHPMEPADKEKGHLLSAQPPFPGTLWRYRAVPNLWRYRAV